MRRRSDHRAGELEDEAQRTPGVAAKRWDWISALRNSELDPPARLVAFAVSFHMDADGGQAYPGGQLLVRETGLSLRSVRTKLALLEASGWLECVHRGKSTASGGRTANRYRATIPISLAEASRPVQDVHRCKTDTGAGRSTTGAPPAKTGAGRAHQTFSTPDDSFAHARASDLAENWAPLYEHEHELRTAVATELHLPADATALDIAVDVWRTIRTEGAA